MISIRQAAIERRERKNMNTWYWAKRLPCLKRWRMRIKAERLEEEKR